MLGKLIKYDFKSLFKSIFPIYLFTLFLSLICRLSYMLTDKIPALKFTSGLTTFIFVILLIGLPFVTFFMSISNYYNKMVKDEAYLTHTLPVKKSSLINSKLLISVLFMLITFVVMFLAIYICYSDIIKVFEYVYDFIINYVDDFDIMLFVILMVLSLLFGYIYNLLMIYLAIAFGQTRATKKGLFSVIFWFIIYNITSVVTSVLTLIPALFSNKYASYFENDLMAISDVNILLTYSLIITIVVNFVFYIMTVKTMEKKLNLD